MMVGNTYQGGMPPALAFAGLAVVTSTEGEGGHVDITGRGVTVHGTPPILKWAAISEDGKYRYALGRRWGDGLPMSIVMLNPSTADHLTDDPTIRRCIAFAKRYGCGGIVVRNLFALRTPYPKELLRVADPFGPENRRVLEHEVSGNQVAAWGRLPKALRPPFMPNVTACFGKNKDGSPKHPLYLSSNAPLVEWP